MAELLGRPLTFGDVEQINKIKADALGIVDTKIGKNWTCCKVCDGEGTIKCDECDGKGECLEIECPHCRKTDPNHIAIYNNKNQIACKYCYHELP